MVVSRSYLISGMIALGLLLIADSVVAQSDVRVTPDGRRTLISKDVGEYRWAISLNGDDRSVTGNVFSEGEGPQFVWCSDLVPGSDPVSLDCYGSQSCQAAPCTGGDWVSLGVVQLPASFFLPRASAAQLFARKPTVARAAEQERASGVQVALDGRRLLINKDVNGQRWSITLNLDDRTVTGNVFATDSGPTFLWCQQKAIDADQVTLSCSSPKGSASDRAHPLDGWAFLTEVSLPASFFRPPAPAVSAKQGCIATARGGDMVSASTLCGLAAQADPADGLVALIRAVANPVTRALESAELLDLLAKLGVSVRGSAFDVCALGAVIGMVERDSAGVPRVPRTGVMQKIVSQDVERLTDLVLTRISDVPVVDGIQFPLEDLPACLRAFGSKIADVDETDLKAAASVTELLTGLGRLGAAYEVDVDLAAAIQAGSSFADVFRSTPTMFTLASGGTSELDRSRIALDAALRDFVEATNLARVETDDQSDDLLVLSVEDAADADRAVQVAAKLRAALVDTATFEASRFNLPVDERLQLGRFFSGGVPSLREFFPNTSVGGGICHVPDPTLGGIAPDVTQAQIDDFLYPSCSE